MQIDSSDNGCNNQYMTYLDGGGDPGSDWDNACILEDIEINANGGAYALYIYGGASGFTDFLIIRKAKFHNATSGDYGSGLKILDDAHVRTESLDAEDVLTWNNDIGVYLHTVDNVANGVILADLNSQGNNQGLRMYESDYIEFDSCIFDSNTTGTAYGARIRYSHRNTFDTCGFSDNGEDGMWFQSSDQNDILYGQIEDNGNYGVQMDTSDTNEFYYIDINANGNYGAHLGEDCDGNYFAQNSFSGNNSNGVQAYDYDVDDTWYRWLSGPGCLSGNYWHDSSWSCTESGTCDSKTMCSNDYIIDTNSGTEKDYYPLRYDSY